MVAEQVARLRGEALAPVVGVEQGRAPDNRKTYGYVQGADRPLPKIQPRQRIMLGLASSRGGPGRTPLQGHWCAGGRGGQSCCGSQVRAK